MKQVAAKMARKLNKAFKPLAKLARTSGTPRLIARGFAIVARTPLHTSRCLTGR